MEGLFRGTSVSDEAECLNCLELFMEKYQFSQYQLSGGRGPGVTTRPKKCQTGYIEEICKSWAHGALYKKIILYCSSNTGLGGFN